MIIRLNPWWHIFGALCGHSLGGRVAYMLASRYPECVTRLIIAVAAPLEPPTDDRTGPASAPEIETFATVDGLGIFAVEEVDERPHWFRIEVRQVAHNELPHANMQPMLILRQV